MVDTCELIWNLKRLIRDGFPMGLPISKFEDEYRNYFTEIQPTPSSVEPGAKDWAQVFRKSEQFLKWFRLDRKKVIKVLAVPERDLKVYFTAVCYTQYYMAREGAKSGGGQEYSDLSDSEDDTSDANALMQELDLKVERAVAVHNTTFKDTTLSSEPQTAKSVNVLEKSGTPMRGVKRELAITPTPKSRNKSIKCAKNQPKKRKIRNTMDSDSDFSDWITSNSDTPSNSDSDSDTSESNESAISRPRFSSDSNPDWGEGPPQQKLNVPLPPQTVPVGRNEVPKAILKSDKREAVVTVTNASCKESPTIAQKNTDSSPLLNQVISPTSSEMKSQPALLAIKMAYSTVSGSTSAESIAQANANVRSSDAVCPSGIGTGRTALIPAQIAAVLPQSRNVASFPPVQAQLLNSRSHSLHVSKNACSEVRKCTDEEIKKELDDQYQVTLCKLCNAKLHSSWQNLVSHYEGGRHKTNLQSWLKVKGVTHLKPGHLTWRAVKRQGRIDHWETLSINLWSKSVEIVNTPAMTSTMATASPGGQITKTIKANLKELLKAVEGGYFETPQEFARKFQSVLWTILSLKLPTEVNPEVDALLNRIRRIRKVEIPDMISAHHSFMVVQRFPPQNQNQIGTNSPSGNEQKLAIANGKGSVSPPIALMQQRM